jgi:hypothetical protein
MPHRARLVSILAALAAAVTWVGGSAAVLPNTLWGYYTMNCTFRLVDDTGKTVSGGGTIAPGDWQVILTSPVPFASVDLSGVYDLTACKGSVLFRLTGPGVSISMTLDDGDGDHGQREVTLLANSTYTALDDNNAAGTRTTFTTSGTVGAGATAGGSSSSTSSKGTTQKELAGSAAYLFRGALDATVYTTGKLALNRAGKVVSSLKQGKYTFSVDDESKTAGFTLKSLRGKPVTITSKVFVGTHNVTLTLKQGRWFYYSPGGKQLQFIVRS